MSRWFWAALCVLALAICVIDRAPWYVTAINVALAGWTVAGADASRKAGDR